MANANQNKKLLIIHGGGPTAVMNSSLYGVIKAAKKNAEITQILGAKNGTNAVLEKDFIDLSQLTDIELSRLLTTPGTVIGSSRHPLDDAVFEKMVDKLIEEEIAYVIFNGGNGTMGACGKLHLAIQKKGSAIQVIGIPKTIDNDLAVIDHAPGFGSAARYLAQTVREIGLDVESLPIHITVIEAMGRNAGWLTAASSLARTDQLKAPHLIYLPERPFSEEQFLTDVKKLHEELGSGVVVVSEGLTKENGKPIVPPIFKTERATYYGEVGSYLANLIIQKLGIKARSEKPGLAGRCSISHQSLIDRAEAIEVGKFAVEGMLAGVSGKMVGIFRTNTKNYDVKYEFIDVTQVMLVESYMPDAYINPLGNDVSEAFIEWVKPLVGSLEDNITILK